MDAESMPSRIGLADDTAVAASMGMRAAESNLSKVQWYEPCVLLCIVRPPGRQLPALESDRLQPDLSESTHGRREGSCVVDCSFDVGCMFP
jgi:hypothetical protein